MAPTPIAGSNTKRTSLSKGFMSQSPPRSVSSTFQVVDGKGRRVGLGVLGIEALAVEECFRLVTTSAVGVTELLHRLFVDVGAHHLLGDALVVGLAFHHAPAPEL